ncbi:MAG: sensor domain-containing diguanylate cyclase [Acidobacteriota bacterium]
MMSAFEENELCDLMIEVELLMKYRNFQEATRRLETILVEHPEYLPAKEALQEVFRLTGQARRAQELQREVKALSEQRAKDQLSATAREEYAKIEKRQFAEKVDRLTKIIYQGRTVEEVLNSTASQLLEILKSDRCLILLVQSGESSRDHFELCCPEVLPSLNDITLAFLKRWLAANPGFDSPVACLNCQSDPGMAEFRPLLIQHQIHAMMAYPLVYKSSAIGWLVLQQCVPYYKWSESDETLLVTASSHLATAIHNVQSLSALQEKAFRDNLTGLYNRHFLQERLVVELSNAQRQGLPLSLAILDIDHFKRINDTHGHPAGDNVLAKLAFLLKTSVRKGSVVARWGGEEFIVGFPGLTVATAAMIMDRFREKVSQTLAIQGEAVTVSIGVAEARMNLPGELQEIQQDLIAQADLQLYAAKRAGRNRVMYEPGADQPENVRMPPFPPGASDSLVTRARSDF